MQMKTTIFVIYNLLINKYKLLTQNLYKSYHHKKQKKLNYIKNFGKFTVSKYQKGKPNRSTD